MKRLALRSESESAESDPVMMDLGMLLALVLPENAERSMRCDKGMNRPEAPERAGPDRGAERYRTLITTVVVANC